MFLDLPSFFEKLRHNFPKYHKLTQDIMSNLGHNSYWLADFVADRFYVVFP